MNVLLKRGLLVFILLIMLIAPVLANPVVLNGPLLGVIPFYQLIIIFVSYIIIEFIIVYIILKKRLKKSSPLLKSVFIINIITFPITQFLAIVLSIVLFDFGLRRGFYFAEIFPFFAEFFLLRWQLNKLKDRKILINDISNKEIALIVFVVNFTTFIIGIYALGALVGF